MGKVGRVDQVGSFLSLKEANVFRRTTQWATVTNDGMLLKSGPAPVNKTAFLRKEQRFQDSPNCLRFFLG